MEYKIKHGQHEINFTVELRNRKTTSIQVHRDRTVRVLAPKFTSGRVLLKQVSERAEWIIKKQLEFSKLPSANPGQGFTEGENVSYLGKLFILHFVSGKPSVHIANDSLVITAPESYDTDQKKKLLQKWYRKQSEIIFPRRLALCMKAVQAIGIKNTPELKSRVLKRSWGSCSAKGRINLNLELVSAPAECIDYVMLHELCHLIEQNHSPRFYKLVTRVCPDWKSRKKKLNDNYRTMLV